ncbi:MAG: hypothetical protein EAX95_03405 [Candidatus Thorarchaeota archaeon]|nr:hypothetical protein [Candidatus Thorarchaeota archaeon]
MLPAILTLGAIITIAFYLYSHYIEKSPHRGRANRILYRGRDMWKASLLDCDYEPTKYVFGPGKAIPAERSLSRLSSDTPFYIHKEHS